MSINAKLDTAETLVIAAHTAILQDHKNDIQEAERDEDDSRLRIYHSRLSEREHELRTARNGLRLLRSAIARNDKVDATAARDIVLATLRNDSDSAATYALATLPWSPFYERVPAMPHNEST